MKPLTAVSLNLLSQRSLRGHVERPFCKLQILAKSQLAAAVSHTTLHTPETGHYIKSCSTSALPLRSTSCVPLKSARNVMGPVSRDASASDGEENEHSVLTSPTTPL